MTKPKNTNITSFFKPVSMPKSGSSSQASGSQRYSSQTLALPIPPSLSQRPPLSPSPPPALLSSSPVAPAARDRDAVIKGSEDEDEDEDFSSDGDLPSLFTKPKAAAGTVPLPASRRDLNLCATPKAKRTALVFHSSSLTIHPKHKFDMKALIKHQFADNALNASEELTESVLRAKSPSTAIKSKAATDDATASREKGTTSLHDTMRNIIPDADGSQDEGNRDKLLRAVKRAEDNGDRIEYRFFENSTTTEKAAKTLSTAARNNFPKAAATGTWKFLSPAQGRAELFEDGIPYFTQMKRQSLPDEIFLWILREIPCEKSRTLREEYLRLLELCPDQAGRVMDECLVTKVFRDLGASERALDSRPGPYPGGKPPPYQPNQQDWTALRSCFRILQKTARGLGTSALTCSISLLLRLGMDRVVREDQAVQRDYEDTLCSLIEAIPEGLWDQFCGEIGTSLYQHVEEYSLRWDAVSSIPLLHSRLSDLRRRLAIVFVFDDPHRGQMAPDETFSMHSVIDRFESDDTGAFTVDRQRSDYSELAGLTGLLALAISDGNPPTSSYSSSAYFGGNSSSPPGVQAIKQYNADVDHLARKLKIMWSNIHEGGAQYVSRLEAKVMLKDLERKLEHTIRTRPPAKADIFGIEKGDREEVQRPRQQRFMRKFFEKGRDSAKDRERERSPSLPSLAPVSGRMPRTP